MFGLNVSKPHATAIKKRGERFKVYCLVCGNQFRRTSQPVVLGEGKNVRVEYFCEGCQKQHTINLPNLAWGDTVQFDIVTVEFK